MMASHKPSASHNRTIKTAVIAGISALCTLIAACSNNTTDEPQTHNYFGYAIDDYLITTNVATSIGASSNAHQLVGRLYPGAYVNGPEGQRIPNTDLVQTRALPGAQLRVEYKITDKAVYSDGQPITCDAFLLAHVAATTKPLFDSYNPLMEQIDTVNCQPGSKTATVVFKDTFGPRWRYLFSGGTLLPAHAIAAKANMSLADLNTALHNRDIPRLQPIADIWNTGFELGKFDPALQVSSGPFYVQSVGENSEVTLARNDKYYGEPPVLDKLVIWPKGTDLRKLATDGNLQIAEVESVNETNWIDRNDNKNPYVVKSVPGVLSEQLILASAGTLGDQADRHAFAACIDQTAVAQASAKESGVQVDPVALRTVRPGDTIAQHLKEISDQHLGVDIESAKRLEGKTIRIGYFAPDVRKAAMVAAIKASCTPAGINVEDVSGEAVSVGNLPQTYKDADGVDFTTEGKADAVLQAVDPQFSFPYVANPASDIEVARREENLSWDYTRTVPLSVQPRVFILDRSVQGVAENTDLFGVGWNMDRWKETEMH